MRTSFSPLPRIRPAAAGDHQENTKRADGNDAYGDEGYLELAGTPVGIATGSVSTGARRVS